MTRPVQTDPEHRQDGDHHGRGHDRDVRDVAHEPVRVGDEVDDVPAREAGLPEEAVDEVAERTTQQETQRDRPRARADAAHHAHDDDDDRDHDDGQEPRHAGRDGERRTGVVDEPQPEQRPHERIVSSPSVRLDSAHHLVSWSSTRTRTARTTVHTTKTRRGPGRTAPAEGSAGVCGEVSTGSVGSGCAEVDIGGKSATSSPRAARRPGAPALSAARRAAWPRRRGSRAGTPAGAPCRSAALSPRTSRTCRPRCGRARATSARGGRARC